MGHWSLRIKSVRDEDKGLYECQLSIHPTQSIFIELRVVGKLIVFNYIANKITGLGLWIRLRYSYITILNITRS